MSNILTEPLHIPIKRRSDRKGVEFCIPAFVKWVSGIIASGVCAGVGLLLSISITQATFKVQIDTINTRLDTIETKMDRANTDRFTGTDAEKLENRLMAEIERRHK